MTELRFETFTMPAADLGPENPLPPLRMPARPRVKEEYSGFSAEMLRNMAYGHVANPLPYTVQDRYTRELQPKAFRVAVLENENLKATFLLERGGRLRSLYHKPGGRELLEANPIFQPANLAIRNAWFSGGVEWNIGLRGHCALTCSSLFATRVERGDGTPILRMYEWERMRQVPYQIDAWLPAGSPVLFVRVRIVNPHDREVPMYWWSNIAVPETADTRVLVPADSAYTFGYGSGGPTRAEIPHVEGTDITYTANIQRAADFFFHIPDGQRPWIAALDREGKGLIQTSTDLLKGRKLFMWGMGVGGRRWQEFLSEPGHAYIEIQAGLARTQMEHLPMPAGAVWSWQEAYGLMEADPAIVHGDDWKAAHSAVDTQLERLIPRGDVDAEFEHASASTDQPPAELVHRGSGWGALEALRREASAEAPFCSQGLVFGQDSLEDNQRPWVSLIQKGVLPEADPSEEPSAYLVQAEWRSLLEDSVKESHGANWTAWYHLGVMRCHAGDRDGAREAWTVSLNHRETPWATRNLAILALEDGRLEESAERYVAACRLCPTLIPLAIECAQALLDAGRAQEWLDLLSELPDPVRSAGRLKLVEGRAALETGDFERVERLFDQKLVIDDLREGERSLSHLWFEYHERRLSTQERIPIDDTLRARVRRDFPVPSEIDFRMSADDPVASEWEQAAQAK